MRLLTLIVLTTVLSGCGDAPPPPPKLDAESIKASQDEQRQVANSESTGG